MGLEREGARDRAPAEEEAGTARVWRGDGRQCWRRPAAPRRARLGEREDPLKSPGKGRGSRAAGEEGSPVAVAVAVAGGRALEAGDAGARAAWTD